MPIQDATSLAGRVVCVERPGPAAHHQTLNAQGETMCAAVGLRLAKSSCSRHFKVLREAGVIRTRRLGTAYMNTLRRDELDAHFPGLLDAVLHALAGQRL